MQVHVFENAKQVGQAAATLFAAQLLRKPDSVLGLATGSSPIDCYQQLIQWHKAGILDFSKCVSYNLDEYCNLPVEHECSYHAFMNAQLFDHINMKETHVPNGNAEDLQAECARYDAAIQAAGGIDMQLLGIGRNGHIGFNEPSDHFVFGTQIVNLTESTIQANRRFFESEKDVPRQAISLGIGGIMAAKEIVLIAMGEDKAQAIRDTVYGEVTPKVQASILRNHPHVTILVDKAAASLL
ncbi:MAG: glucosamine-6-phosphate deaminase [Clostridiales bacterium]|nr:glucosamine-6-phosphate deaminase [Clostridiales bacterium]